MDFSPLLQNLLNPPILFFFLGLVAAFVKSDLEIPQPLPKFFSLYLLLSIGFHGGVELREGGIGLEAGLTLVVAIVMAFVVPVYAFFILKRKYDAHNAAAIAATYGSISAVTFITAVSFLNSIGQPFGGHMVAAMALMESPAIIIGVMLLRRTLDTGGSLAWGHLFKEAFLNGAVVLLVGSLLIGLATGASGMKTLHPFTEEIFKGVLSFFLLDMGIVASRRLAELRNPGAFPIAFAVAFPLVNAFIGIALAMLLGLDKGDALLLSVLCGSASYIAVPAAMRVSIPEANPGLYVFMSLGLTFPFNVLAGIPLYYFVIEQLWR